MTVDACMLLADTIAVLHAMFSLFILAGIIVTPIAAWKGWRFVRHRGLRTAHLAAAAYIMLRTTAGWPCPLTQAEDTMRDAAAERAQTPAVVETAHRIAFRGAPKDGFAAKATIVCLATAGLFLLVPPDSKHPLPAGRASC